MRIFYIRRGRQDFSLIKRVHHSFNDLLEYRDQEGFFDASLEYAGEVEYVSLTDTQRILGEQNYDWIIINWKQQGFKDLNDRVEAIFKYLGNTKINKALFISAARADYMLPDSVLNNFDIIFKREPYRDRNKYNISDKNKAKIVPTMIHCPFVHSSRNNLLSKMFHLVRPIIKPCTKGEEKYEVGFSGADAAEHSLRRDVWQRVVDEGFTKIGGLQPNPYTKRPIPEKLKGPRLRGKAYRDSLCQAKINLALDGIGEYTFRHQELLYLGKFILSSPTIRDLELPIPLEEGKHYVAFDDLDDMVAKIRYYLEHEEERKQIAQAGKELFDTYYNPEKHGQEIRKALKSSNKLGF
ncbi:MAG: glycosyltransferase [Patescibacteria group bacterium]